MIFGVIFKHMDNNNFSPVQPAQPVQPIQPASLDGQSSAPKSNNKLLLIILCVILVVAGAVFAVIMLNKPANNNATTPTEDNIPEVNYKKYSTIAAKDLVDNVMPFRHMEFFENGFDSDAEAFEAYKYEVATKKVAANYENISTHYGSFYEASKMYHALFGFSTELAKQVSDDCADVYDETEDYFVVTPCALEKPYTYEVVSAKRDENTDTIVATVEYTYDGETNSYDFYFVNEEFSYILSEVKHSN